MQEESGPNGWMMFPLILEGNPHSIIQADMNRRSVALVSCAAGPEQTSAPMEEAAPVVPASAIQARRRPVTRISRKATAAAAT